MPFYSFCALKCRKWALALKQHDGLRLCYLGILNCAQLIGSRMSIRNDHKLSLTQSFEEILEAVQPMITAILRDFIFTRILITIVILLLLRYGGHG